MKLSKMHKRVRGSKYLSSPFDIPKIMPEKGKRNGNCNRTACQAVGAFWWNRGSYSWYCTDCALMLSQANAGDEFCKDEPLCKLDVEAMNEWEHPNEFMTEDFREWALSVSERLCAR